MSQVQRVQVLGNYGQGYEEVHSEPTRQEAKKRLKEYQENEPQYSFKIRTIYWAHIRAYARRAYNKLRESDTGHNSHSATKALEKAGEYYDVGHGVEGFCDQQTGRHGVTYLNMGDMYATTVYFDSDTERFYVGCVGNVIENDEEGRYQ